MDCECPRPLVVVADDNDVNRLVIRQMVELAKLACVTAVDGQDAVEKTLAHRPGLVVMDLNMPNLTGNESARAIGAALGPAAPRIVMMSSNEDLATGRAGPGRAGPGRAGPRRLRGSRSISSSRFGLRTSSARSRSLSRSRRRVGRRADQRVGTGVSPR